MTTIHPYYRMVPLLLCLAAGTAAQTAATSATAPTSATVQAQVDWTALEDELGENPPAMLQRAKALQQQFDAAGDTLNGLRARVLMIQAEVTLERYEDMATQLKEAWAIARRLKDLPSLVQLALAEAALKRQTGKHAEAEALYEAAMRNARAAQMPKLEALVLLDRGRLELEASRTNEALARMFEAYRVFERLNDRREMINALASIADVYSKIGDEPTAIVYYQRALKTSANQDRFNRSVTLFNLGLSHMALKQYTLAETAFLESMALSKSLGDPVGVAYVQYRLGRLAMLRGKDAVAARYFEESKPVFVKTGNQTMLLNVLQQQALLAAGQKNPKALDDLRAAREIMTALNTPERRVGFHETEAEVMAAFGRYREAYEAMLALRKAEREDYVGSDRRLAAEMKTRFDTQLKEAENALLRSREALQQAKLREADARRLSLILALVASAAGIAGLGFVLWRQIKEKRHFADLALYDELTGAPNRRHILRLAAHQLELVAHGDGELTVAVIDLDHFKQINDRFGHDVGDAVLIAFVRAAGEALRRGTRIGRLGGEEWLLLMPDTRLDEVAPVFERLQQAFQCQRIDGLGAETRLSFSMGAAQAAASERLDHLLARADRAMYEAKAAGRGRLILAAPPGS
jgi:diguanylate cyclase (GGDEF)-like protein